MRESESVYRIRGAMVASREMREDAEEEAAVNQKKKNLRKLKQIYDMMKDDPGATVP